MKFVPKRLERTADISRGDTSWQSFAKNAISVIIVFVAGYFVLGAVAEVMARTIPDHWEARAFGGTAEWSAEFDGIGSASEEEIARVDAVLERMTAVDGLRELPYHVLVIPTPEMNAFAFPGGTIGVTSGLLDLVESEIGLAMVLGHELGHHQGRHPLRRMGRSLVFSVAGAVLFGRAGGRSLIDRSVALAESGYSRAQERDADAFGLRLVFEVYGETEGSLEFFETVDEFESDDAQPRWAAFLQSHPLTAERLVALRELRVALENER